MALPAQDHPQVMFKNWEERMDVGLFHHFPPPYPACISEVANTNVFLFFSFLCAKIQAVIHGRADEIEWA